MDAVLQLAVERGYDAIAVVTSTTTSTSFVGRTGGAPGSVIQSATLAPPTKTTSSSTGSSAADESDTRGCL
jgi:hypothetical protein